MARTPLSEEPYLDDSGAVIPEVNSGGSIFLEKHPLISQWFLRLLLVAVTFKRYLKRVLYIVQPPMRWLVTLFVRFIGIHLYRFLFWCTKSVTRFFLPLRRLTLQVVIHRYAVHGLMLAAALFTGFFNLQQSEVRAETVGKSSLMFALVNGEADVPIRVVADHQRRVLPTNQFDTFLVSPSLALNEQAPLFVPGDSATTTVDVQPRSEIVTYTVADGDSLWLIAQKHGLKLSSVLWANQLTVKSVLKPGSSLIIPPQDGVIYAVKSGDTLSSIAKRFGIQPQTIQTANAEIATLSIGQKLILPGAEPIVVAASKPPVSFRSVLPTTTPGKPTTQPVSVTGWVWPTNGRYIVRGLSWKHTGVDIDCNGRANGTSTDDNYAAADGIVQYAGWKKGYGNVVEISHDGGIMTRYGHFYSLSVKAGQQVSAGANLGRCGSTGNSSGTHLHFEVIKGGTFQNPLNYIR